MKRTSQLVNDAQNSGVLAMLQVIPRGDQNHPSDFRSPGGGGDGDGGVNSSGNVLGSLRLSEIT